MLHIINRIWFKTSLMNRSVIVFSCKNLRVDDDNAGNAAYLIDDDDSRLERKKLIFFS